MKILRKAILLFLIITEIAFMMIYASENNAFANAKQGNYNRNIINIAVLLYSFDDLFAQQLKQNLENIQNENKDKIKFTFYDGKNNIDNPSKNHTYA